VYPNLESLQAAFPALDENFIRDDLAYPAMLAFLPAGILGLVVASLVAAFMSTISTHLNWGSSYVVNDVYKRFVKPEASEKELVRIGRLSTVVLMVLAGVVALFLESAMQSFNILLSIGAGTGLIFILRWFWWRVNAATEISGMVVSFFVALFFEFGYERLGFEPLAGYVQLIASVSLTTVVWLLVTFLTPASSDEVLERFYLAIRPVGPGWERVRRSLVEKGIAVPESAEGESLTRGIAGFLLGSFSVYFFLFGVGYVIYGNLLLGIALLALATGGIAYILKRVITN
jgi:Na+/proline symporter